MSDENARVEIHTHGDGDEFWLVASVNGLQVSGHVPVPSISDGAVAASRVANMVRDVYRRAYRDGVKACQASVKDALGIPMCKKWRYGTCGDCGKDLSEEERGQFRCELCSQYPSDRATTGNAGLSDTPDP